MTNYEFFCCFQGRPTKLGLLFVILVWSGSAVSQKSNGAQFSDLLGMSQKQKLDEKTTEKIPVPEKEKPEVKVEVPETKKESSAEPEKGKKSNNDGIRMILAGAAETSETRRESNDPEMPVLFKRPSMRSLGFPTPMSFLQNFKDNVDWRRYIANKLDNLEGSNRVKRSTLDEAQLRNAMIAAILQRQLVLAEDKRTASLPPPPPPHHVSSINVASPLRAPDAFALA